MEKTNHKDRRKTGMKLSLRWDRKKDPSGLGFDKEGKSHVLTVRCGGGSGTIKLLPSGRAEVTESWSSDARTRLCLLGHVSWLASQGFLSERKGKRQTN